MSASARFAVAAIAASLSAAAPAAHADDGRSVATVAPSATRTAQMQIDGARRNAATPKRDVFAPQSWTPPAPRPAQPKPPPEPHGPPPPPPAPSPPALTLVYLGQLDVPGEPTVYYLAQGARVIAVSIGDTIDGIYRVDAVEPDGLALVYVPLNVKQILSLNRPS